MRLPSLSVLGIVSVVVVAVILAWLPRSMEVTLHLLSERLAFVLAESAEPRSPIQNMPLTALKLRGFESFAITVRRLSAGGRTLVSSDSQVILHNPHRAGSLTVSGEALRLLELPLAPGAQGLLYADPPYRVSLHLQNPEPSQLTLAVQGALTLTLENVVVQDAGGNTLLAGASARLELLPVSNNLVLTQAAQRPWGLILDVSQHSTARAGGDVPLVLAPRLKIRQVDMRREQENRWVSAVQRLWVEPLIPDKEPWLPPVYVQVREHDVFTLLSVVLTAQGLECTLVGTTNTVKVGKDKPERNIVPSWLEYLVKHPLGEFLKWLWGKS